MVTVVGPPGPSGGVYDQPQAPVASSCVMLPSETVSVTVLRPWASSKAPELLAGTPSSTVTAPSLRVIVGAWTSQAPMSTTPALMRAKPLPRWSVVTSAETRALLPALIAGLPGKRGMVCVGPPWSPSGARSELTGLAAMPTRLPAAPLAKPLPVPSPIRLLLPETPPLKSARSPPEVWVLPATMTLARVAVLPKAVMSPPPYFAELPLMVALVIHSSPSNQLNTPPPYLAAELPLMVVPVTL